MKILSDMRRSLNLINSYYFNHYQRLYVNVTGRCNSHCLYCEVHSLDPEEDLPLSTILAVIDEALRLGFKEIVIGGGEPFRRKDIWEILRYTLAKDAAVIMDTNGLVIRDMNDEEFDLLIRSVTEFEISLDSHIEATHDYLRGRKGVFRKTVAGLKRLSQAEGVGVTVFTVVTRHNYRDFPGLVAFIKELNLEKLWFLPLNLGSNFPNVAAMKNKREHIIDEDHMRQLEATIAESLRVANKLSVSTNLMSIRKWMSFFFTSQFSDSCMILDMVQQERIVLKYRCVVPFESVYISHRGGIQPCAMLPELTNLEDSSFEQGLEKVETIKRALKKGRFPRGCQNCLCQFETNLKFSVLLSPLANRRYLLEHVKDRISR